MIIDDGDVEDIFKNGDFNTDAVFTISTGNTLTVSGWLQKRTDPINVPGGEMEAVEASFTCPTSRVGTVKNEISVVIDGDTYTVKRKHKVGPGFSLIYLKTT